MNEAENKENGAVFLWCDGCHRPIPLEETRQKTGGYACPHCGRRLNRAVMERQACPDCGRVLMYLAASKDEILCPCKMPLYEATAGVDAGTDAPRRPEAAPLSHNKRTDILPCQEAPAAAGETGAGNSSEPNSISLEAKNAPVVSHADTARTPGVSVPEKAKRQAETAAGPVSLAWDFQDGGELIYRHPRGAHIQQGDALVLAPGQCACFTAGGVAHWVTEPGVYPLGYESRTEQEILKAQLLGEKLPPLLCTDVLLIDLKRHAGLEWRPGPLVCTGNTAVTPRVRYAVRVADAPALAGRLVAGQPPTLAAIRERIHQRLQSAFLSFLTGRISGNLKEARAALAQCRDALEGFLQAAVGRDGEWGLAVEEIALESCAVSQVEFCPSCGAIVERGAKSCPQGHALSWCGLCGGMMQNGLCPQGHRKIFCPYCGKEVMAGPGGGCPVHGAAHA